ncbi:MAG: NAD(P)H-nitrite reductase large subunit [Flavobacteriales bacterium]|jgi:NAD(P)H-nitrite reductase large subunit|tara:strand:- start:1661 stop:2995 length:1335 start_codon:yes stop_codon:yes gene_type:complete
MTHVAIIGNGISGVTAARHIRKNSDYQITLISAETDYFFSRTALMYVYMGHMKFEHTQPYEPWFWKKNRIDLRKGYVEKIDYSDQNLKFADGSELKYDQLILATGSTPNKFGWKGQDLDGVGGLFSKQDLDKMEQFTQNITRGVIVGGGLIGVEMAEMLLSRNIPVTFLVRENQFWGNVLPKQESDLIMRHMKEHHVDLRLSSELDEIIDDGTGRVKAIKTKSGDIIECGWVGLTAGVSPNIKFLKNTELETNRGILVGKDLQTNIPGVYAIGDCAEFKEPVAGRRSIEQVWYTGRIMGETVAQTITGHPCEYTPGNWFNSAKFFDVEYQTYGWVFPNLPEGQKDFYWEHEKGKMCMHFVFEKKSRKFIGINTFGIRLRHNVFDGWLNESASIELVLEHLKDANFDPEFYTQYELEIVAKFNAENGTAIQPKKKSWKRILKFMS